MNYSLVMVLNLNVVISLKNIALLMLFVNIFYKMVYTIHITGGFP